MGKVWKYERKRKAEYRIGIADIWERMMQM